MGSVFGQGEPLILSNHKVTANWLGRGRDEMSLAFYRNNKESLAITGTFF